VEVENDVGGMHFWILIVMFVCGMISVDYGSVTLSWHLEFLKEKVFKGREGTFPTLVLVL